MSFLPRNLFPTRPAGPAILLDQAMVESTGPFPDYDCVQAMVNYVNSACERAYYRPEELPPVALQIYEVDRYLGQVLNGGHGQYFHNHGHYFGTMADLVDAGLRQLGAKAYLRIFRQFLRAVDGREPAVSLETSTHMIEIADPLDSAFFALEAKTPLSSVLAAHIRDMREAERVPTHELPGRFQDIASENPFLSTRRERKAIDDAACWFAAPFLDATMVLGRAKSPDLFAGIGQAGRQIIMDGAPAFVFDAETLNSQVILVFGEIVTLAFERADPAGVTAEAERRAKGEPLSPGDPDFERRFWLRQGAGKRIAALRTEEARALDSKLIRLNVGLACHDLLRMAKISDPITHAAMISRPDEDPGWLIKTGDHLHLLQVSRAGAALWSADGRNKRAEITQQHLQERLEDLAD